MWWLIGIGAAVALVLGCIAYPVFIGDRRPARLNPKRKGK